MRMIRLIKGSLWTLGLAGLIFCAARPAHADPMDTLAARLAKGIVKLSCL